VKSVEPPFPQLPNPISSVSSGVSTKGELSAPFLDLALEAGQLGAWEWNVAEGSVNWSRQLEAIHGLAEGSFPGTFEAFASDIHQDDRQLVMATIERTIQERRRSYEIEYRIVLPDGQVRWLEARGRLFVDEHGRPARMLGVCRDATERRRREEQAAFLADATRILTSSLEPASVLDRVAQLAVPRFADWCVVHLPTDGGGIATAAVAHVDPSKVAHAWDLQRRWPPRLEAAAGVGLTLRTSRSQLVPRVPPETLEELAESPEHLRLLEELELHSGMVVPLVSRGRTLGAITLISAESRREFTRRDLDIADEFASRAALALDNAQLFAELGRARDELEDQYRREQEARAAAEHSRDQLAHLQRVTASALRGREDLLAMVSHDLRGPLGVVSLSADQMIREVRHHGSEPPLQLRSILRSAKRMERLIRDMLDFSAIDAGTLRVTRAAHPIALIAEQAAEAARPRARERGIDLTLEVSGEIPPVLCDHERVLQVFDNLLGNAIKFTDPGGRIEVRVAHERGTAVITVSDSGVGIAPEDLPRIFDRYWHNAQRHEEGGSESAHGLGLFITKGLVEVQGGSIWVESSPGQGSAFSFSLPCAHAAE
jgi:PAS domain S-box-containing protein